MAQQNINESFKQFLAKVTGTSLETLVKHLKKDCSKFIQDSTAPLYRGASETPTSYTKMQVRKDRKPSASSAALTNAIDKVAEKKIGLKPRTTTLFVTPRLGQATGYGKVSMVFMIGDFQPVIIKGGYDLYSQTQEYVDAALGTDGDVRISNATPDQIDKVAEFIGEKFEKVNLPDAIKNHGEIMMDGNSYYVVNTVWLAKKFKLSPEEFLAKLQNKK